MNEAKYIQRLPEKALDALYDSLSVQTMPEGRYDGRAWIYGHPVLGWLASLVWRGKVFYDERFARNRILGVLMVRGWLWRCLTDAARRDFTCQYEIEIHYRSLGLVDKVRQVSPTLYLGRMQWRRWTVHFTLSQER